MNSNTAIKICNWLEEWVYGFGSIIWLFLLVTSAFFGIFGSTRSILFFIPFFILSIFLFSSFFVRYRLKREWNLGYDILDSSYKEATEND